MHVTRHTQKDSTQAAEESSGIPAADTMSQQDAEKAEVELRKSKAAKAWAAEKVGEGRVELVQLLQLHRVAVPGGPKAGHALLDALMKWRETT
ncbi:hypothetical protein WJX84_006437 [Apatococcus fuscideae]|uniref:Uncharacterized protein n=1 Tax=Apatococcus fuscideae TaxID=2026836 RepID=A0AAW1TEP5_9CHLO